ncbi:MAG: 4-hydroxybenzoate octaprenyltransferase [Bdellovibrionales bacterium]
MAVSHHSVPPLTTTDINMRGWFALLPLRVQVLGLLSRWDRPIGIWLLFWPAAWGLVAAAGGMPSLFHIFLYFLGAVAMRGAGCTINDILDRRLDAGVARTSTRPLPSGLLAPRAAWAWLALQLAIAAAILSQLPPQTWPWALASVPLILLYPLMKRITWWPQAWLGVTFNWGIFLGATSLGGVVDATVLLLYAGAFFWTVGYDTIYATQDADDDALLGIKSTARLFGSKARLAVGTCYATTTFFWLAAGVYGALQPAYFAGPVIFLLLVWHQMRLWKQGNARAAFVSNQWAGAVMCAALVAGYAL